MTPAERDEVRRIAQYTLDAHAGQPTPCACGSCLCARANVRYVPPGDATSRSVVAEVSHSWGRAISIIEPRHRMHPDAAIEIAHALHAAADAAEES